MNNIGKLGAIILAAGSSSRLGQPKQLLSYEGRALIARAAEAALDAHANPVVVVLGSDAGKIRAALTGLPVIITENHAWAEGMGSSIRAGLAALEAATPSTDAVLLAVCDQPHFSAGAVRRLASALVHGFTIAATRHDENAGVPAIFRRTHFPELQALNGAEGARRVIAAHLAETACVDLPGLALDIDTPADRRHLRTS